MTPDQAWEQVRQWLDAGNRVVPQPTHRHAEVVGALIVPHHLRGNLVSDAHLAALAVEHGVPLCSTDTIFARFPEVDWINPVAA